MKRRFLIALGLALVLAASAAASAQLRVRYESVTFADAAIGLAAATITWADGTQATSCYGVLETAQIRYRFDGTDPTSAEGTPLDVGRTLEITGHDHLARFRGIRTGGTSGVIKFHCTR